MKISELIEKLIEFKEKNGDLQISRGWGHGGYGYPNYAPSVENIVTDKAFTYGDDSKGFCQQQMGDKSQQIQIAVLK